MKLIIKNGFRVGLAALLALTLAGCVPPVKKGEAGKSVIRTVEVKGISKKALFARAGDWLALAFVSAPDILKNKDSDRGRYMGKAVNSAAIQSGLTTVFVNVDFNIIIDVKDGRARIILDNYYSYHPEAYAVTHDDMWKLARNFEQHMKTGGKYTDDW